jgi:predicted nucleotidyltransferase/DNA-binding XRE family transcriptional regulator
MPGMSDIASLLREARVRAGLSQAELADLAGTSQSAINRYERGIVEPSISTLRRLLRACGQQLQLKLLPTPSASAPPRRERNLRALLEHQRKRVLEMARGRGAINVRVFGSVAREEDTEESDIDLLVDLEPGHTILDLVGLRRELADALGVSVDVTTVGMLKKHLRSRVLAEAIPL